MVVRVEGEEFLKHADELLEERFGPASVVVTCTDQAQLRDIARVLPGQLTATVQGEDGDPVGPLLAGLQERAGRVLWNGRTIGVSVAHAMHHGGALPRPDVGASYLDGQHGDAPVPTSGRLSGHATGPPGRSFA